MIREKDLLAAPAVAAVAVVLLGLLSCAPQYESGKTACAASGQACPDGYTCINIRCYKVGEEPDAAAPGAGGAGGVGGSTTDARVTGTGGSGGTGGSKDAGGARDANQSLACPNPMEPKSCPARGDVPARCVPMTIDCSSLIMCSGGVRGCATGLVATCSYRVGFCNEPGNKCSDPMFPYPCPGAGDIGPSCYDAMDVDCAGRTICGNETRSTVCRMGARVDCTRPMTMRCVPTTTSDGGSPDSGSDAGRDSGPG